MLLGNDPVRILRNDEEGGGGGTKKRTLEETRAYLRKQRGGGFNPFTDTTANPDVVGTEDRTQSRRRAERRGELEEEQLLADYQRSLVDGKPDTDPVGQPDYDPPRGLGSIGVESGRTGGAASAGSQGGYLEGQEDKRAPFKSFNPRSRGGGGGRARGEPMVTGNLQYRENVLPYAQKIQQNLNEAGEELRLQGAAQAVRGSELKAAYERQAKTLGDLATEYENARKEAYSTSMAEIRKLQRLGDEITNMAPQPGRLFLNAHGAATFASALSIAAGAMNSSRFGGQNTALGIIEGAIQRDLNAQIQAQNNAKAGAQLQRGIFQDMQEAYKSDRVARHAYMNFQYALAAKELKKIAATWDSVIMKSRADQGAAMLMAKGNEQLMLAGEVLVNQKVAYAAGNAQQAISRALGGLTVQNVDKTMQMMSPDNADKRLETMIAGIRKMQEQELISAEQAQKLIEVAQSDMRLGNQIESEARNLEGQGITGTSIVGTGRQAPVRGAAPGQPPAQGIGAQPGSATTSSSQAPGGGQRGTAQPGRGRAAVSKQRLPQEDARPQTEAEKKVAEELKQAMEEFEAAKEAGDEAKVKDLTPKVQALINKRAALQKQTEEYVRQLNIDQRNYSAQNLGNLQRDLDTRYRMSDTRSLSGGAVKEFTRDILGLPAKAKVTEKEYTKAWKRLEQMYPGRIPWGNKTYKTNAVGRKPEDNAALNTQLNRARAFERANGGPMSPVIKAAMAKGMPVLDISSVKAGDIDVRAPVIVAMPNGNALFDRAGTPGGGENLEKGWFYATVAAPPVWDQKKKKWVTPKTPIIEVVTPALVMTKGTKRTNLPKAKQVLGDRGVTQIDESILRKVRMFGASSKKVAELRNRAFPSVAAMRKYQEQAQSGQQIDYLLQVMRNASKAAQRSKAGTLAAKVTNNLISFKVTDIKDPRERAFWKRYQKRVGALVEGTPRKGLTRTQIQKLRDFKATNQVSINPALLKVLAIGYLSQATGRGVPQAFEAQEIAKELGDDLPLTELFSRSQGSLSTAMGAIRSSINGELLENSTIDLRSMNLSGRAK